MGGPSTRRLTEYQKPSGSSSLPPSRPGVLRSATSMRPVDRVICRGLHTTGVSGLDAEGGRADGVTGQDGLMARRCSSAEQYVGRIDHHDAGILDPDPAAQLDHAARFEASDM